MKILRRSISILISASTILCTCPQIYAKTETNGQKILDGAKTIGKYIAPVGMALAMGFIGGAEYGKYNRSHNKEPESYNLYTDYVLESFEFLNSIGNQEKISKRTINKILNEREKSKKTPVPIRSLDNFLVIKNLNGNVYKTKEAIIEAVEYITRSNGKVIFLGNIISNICNEDNLECLLAIIELKSKFDQVIIMRGENEKEFEREFGKGDYKSSKKKFFNTSSIKDYQCQEILDFIKNDTYSDKTIEINKAFIAPGNDHGLKTKLVIDVDKENLTGDSDSLLLKLKSDDTYEYVTVREGGKVKQ